MILPLSLVDAAIHHANTSGRREEREEGAQIENGKRQTETVYMTRAVRSEMTDRVIPALSSPLPGREIPSRLHCCGTQLQHQIKCWGRRVTLW